MFSCCFFFPFFPIKSNLCCAYILQPVAFHWGLVHLPGAKLLKNHHHHTESSSPRSCTISLARGGALCPPPLSVRGFGLTWVCTRLVHAVTTAEFTCAASLLCPGDTVSLWSPLRALILPVFPPPLPHDSWALGRVDAPPPHLLSCEHCTASGLCASHHPLQTEVSLMTHYFRGIAMCRYWLLNLLAFLFNIRSWAVLGIKPRALSMLEAHPTPEPPSQPLSWFLKYLLRVCNCLAFELYKRLFLLVLQASDSYCGSYCLLPAELLVTLLLSLPNASNPHFRVSYIFSSPCQGCVRMIKAFVFCLHTDAKHRKPINRTFILMNIYLFIRCSE